MCFRAMAGGTLPSKASAHGQLQRLDLVCHELPDGDERIRAWERGHKHRLLDICDAYAACWSALRWARTGGGAVDRRSDVTPPLEVLGETTPGEPSAMRRAGLPCGWSSELPGAGVSQWMGYRERIARRAWPFAKPTSTCLPVQAETASRTVIRLPLGC
jgi:hypothetical protein